MTRAPDLSPGRPSRQAARAGRSRLTWLMRTGLAFFMAISARADVEPWGAIAWVQPPPPSPPAVFLVRGEAPPLALATNTVLVPGDLVFTRDGGEAFGHT